VGKLEDLELRLLGETAERAGAHEGRTPADRDPRSVKAEIIPISVEKCPEKHAEKCCFRHFSTFFFLAFFDGFRYDLRNSYCRICLKYFPVPHWMDFAAPVKL